MASRKQREAVRSRRRRRIMQREEATALLLLITATNAMIQQGFIAQASPDDKRFAFTESGLNTLAAMSDEDQRKAQDALDGINAYYRKLFNTGRTQR